MMTRYSVPMYGNPDDRLCFFYWEDMVNWLRSEMEADGNTFRFNITHWKESGPKGKKTKATCQLSWVRINPETKMAEMVSRTVTCEDNTILPTIEVDTGYRIRKEWAVAQW